MSNFLSALEQVSSQDVFFYTEPEILDFTSEKNSNYLKICSKEMEIKIPLSNELTKLKETLGLLQIYLGSEKSILLGWKIKNFLSFAKAKTGVEFKLQGNVLDLSILENYQSIALQRPDTFSDAFKRIRNLMTNSKWKNNYKIYNSVYRLLIETLPRIEALGFIHKKKKKKVYSHYEIDGQINGRLKCTSALSSSFNPHTLSPEEKDNLIPIGFDKVFVSFDYKNMEVTMLQWLSKDDYLIDLISGERDTYESLWEAITSIPSNATNRQKCKEFFLPVIYGLGANTLSENMKIPLEYSKKLIDRIYKTIPISMAWIKKQQESIIDDKVEDYFGRVRIVDSPYKVRNFSVQSPAALICEHKLIKLSEALKNIADVAMHIHDGYILICDRNNLSKTVEISKKILESDDELYPNLNLKALCKVGENLNNLKLYER